MRDQAILQLTGPQCPHFYKLRVWVNDSSDCLNQSDYYLAFFAGQIDIQLKSFPVTSPCTFKTVEYRKLCYCFVYFPLMSVLASLNVNKNLNACWDRFLIRLVYTVISIITFLKKKKEKWSFIEIIEFTIHFIYILIKQARWFYSQFANEKNDCKELLGLYYVPFIT